MRSFGSVVAVVVFVFFVGFLTVTAMDTPGFNYWSWMVTFVIIVLVATKVFGEWAPFIKVTMYQNSCGVVGKVIDLPKKLAGNRWKFPVVVHNKFVPDKFRQVMSWYKNFEALMTGTTILWVEDYAYNFQYLDSLERETPEEVLFHHGRVDGAECKGFETYLREELKAAHYTISKLATVVDQSKGIMQSESRANVSQFKEVIQTAAIALREFEHRLPPKFEGGN